jgi:hypothetical protein
MTSPSTRTPRWPAKRHISQSVTSSRDPNHQSRPVLSGSPDRMV